MAVFHHTASFTVCVQQTVYMLKQNCNNIIIKNDVLQTKLQNIYELSNCMRQ